MGHGLLRQLTWELWGWAWLVPLQPSQSPTDHPTVPVQTSGSGRCLVCQPPQKPESHICYSATHRVSQSQFCSFCSL